MVFYRTQQYNTPHPPSQPHILYFDTGEGGGELNQREGGNSSQSWVENTSITDCFSSLLTLINNCRKVPLLVIFLDDDILLNDVYIVN
jgi:hypothetical protein